MLYFGRIIKKGYLKKTSIHDVFFLFENFKTFLLVRYIVNFIFAHQKTEMFSLRALSSAG